ncbi:hypothetical protein EPO33_04120 [Patescibacteria group bacterium]|nr:MAG: hypothetical protein EPO33_04120 [Patescibacteria group bacterium]
MRKRLLIALAIFAAAFVLNAVLTSSGYFPDPDSFYHAKMAELMTRTPGVRDFPWLTETVFADAYVDHHWGYHLLLVPFVAALGSVEGIQLATLILASLVPAAAFLLVASWGSTRVGAVAGLLLLLNNPFGFRINLAKAPAFSVLFVLMAIAAIDRKKPFVLALLAALYVWSYNGWPLFFIIAGSYAAASLIEAAVAAGPPALRRLATWRAALSPLVAISTGTLVALVANPYFPDNVRFSWLHIVQIGIIGFKDKIGVGGEWYPTDPLALVAQSSFVFGFLLAGIVALVVAAGVTQGRVFRDAASARERRRALWLTVLAVGFFVLAARSRRNVEYFVPFATLAAAALVVFATRLVSAADWRKFFDVFLRLRLWQRVPIFVALAFLIPLILFRDLRSLKNDFDTGIPSSKYSGAAAWLEANAPEGAILWHNDWDDFPYFFLHTTRVRYLVGLDPSFMYVRNKEKYWQWVRETRGEGEDRIGREMARDFGAAYAFVDSDHEELAARFAADHEMTEVYRDADGIIYALPSGTAQ